MKKFFFTIKHMWQLFSQKLGEIVTIFLLSLVYLIIIGFMSLLVKIFRKDLLRKKMDLNISSYWQVRPSNEQTLDRHKYQF